MDPKQILPTGDDRGIAGLPIKLVVSFVVGTAVLGVMLHMVAGVGSLTTSELDANPTPDVVHPGPGTLDVAVVDASGHRVSNATVVVTAGTAGLAGDGPAYAKTNASGVASLHVTPTLAGRNGRGTLEISIKPPNGQYVDRRANTDVLVVG